MLLLFLAVTSCSAASATVETKSGTSAMMFRPSICTTWSEMSCGSSVFVIGDDGVHTSLNFRDIASITINGTSSKINPGGYKVTINRKNGDTLAGTIGIYVIQGHETDDPTSPTTRVGGDSISTISFDYD